LFTLQLAVVEYARHVLGRAEAFSAEFDETCLDPIIIFMPEGSRTHMGGTMRLGVRDTILQTQDCLSARLYKPSGNKISERHRHRSVRPSRLSILPMIIRGLQ
jgi:CTP synthase